MLPDYPRTKDTLSKWYIQHLNLARSKRLGPLERPVQIHFEGDRQEIIREDGTEEVTQYTIASSQIEIDLTDYEQLTVDELAYRVYMAGNDIGNQQAEFIFEKIERSSSTIGHNYDAGGQPLSVELFLDTLESIDITFDADFNPIWPTIIVGPGLEKKMKEIIVEIETSTSNKERFENIMVYKRRKWLDREASRKLVG